MALVLLILFIGIPLLEIAAFIQIGSVIGLGWTLAGIVATAVIGAFVIRLQGFQVIAEIQRAAAQDEIPVNAVIHGAFLLVAGLLLLTPGFVTDTIGFLFLVPPLRLAIASLAWRRISPHVHTMSTYPGYRQSGPGYRQSGGNAGSGTAGDVIEGEAVDITPPSGSGRPRADSPWNPGQGGQ